ncbi:DUF1007 family protein [Shinella sp. AETb1-6]|uniref:DUF1007 family protein n=1 Tax=Shinella sp. AETb1-6 TaxID=2692210 RepID=UPI00136DC2E9|nr:DUF1007 family protein [Shinella sp. AETb1-6]
MPRPIQVPPVNPSNCRNSAPTYDHRNLRNNGLLIVISKSGIYALVTASFVALTVPAMAHPHVFADGRVILDLDAPHQLTAVRNEWTFDKPFSSFAVIGLDKNHDGKLEPSELRSLAETSMKSLADYHFFTWVTRNGVEVELSTPRDYVYRFSHGRLTLSFSMPLKTPAPIDDDVKIEVFDPEYFVAYTFPEQGAIKLAGPGSGCRATYIPPKPLDDQIMATLAAIPAEEHDLPSALRDAAVGLANIFTVKCP